MPFPRAASRYSKALLSLSLEQNAIEEVYADMQAISNACNDSDELRVLLNSPVVKADKKEEILLEIFKGMHSLTELFVKILVRKRREGLLHGIAAHYIEDYKKHKNILTAELRTTYPMDKELRDTIKAKIKGNFSKVEINETIDPDLIGGFILRIDDQQIDTSLRSKLEEIRQEFSKNEYISQL